MDMYLGFIICGNMNIKEDYVSFETAKLLKEKGFDSPCFMAYYETNNGHKIGYDVGRNNYQWDIVNKENGLSNCCAPTLQMAMKWLEKEKHIAIIPVLSSILDDEKFLWDVKIVVAETGEKYSQGWIYEDKESAYNAAINYCLENLI